MKSPKPNRLVILISGSGSNLQAFIDKCSDGSLDASIACVIANKSTAFGLERAKKAGIPTRVIQHRDYENREAFDKALADCILTFSPDLVVLAGFMRILTPGFVKTFHGKLINIHPSLLPKYQGLNTHQRAIDAKDDKAGVTVHYVTEELDGGPGIIQAEVPITDGDSAESLASKVLVKEHLIYPLAVQWIFGGKVVYKNNEVYLDGKPLEGCPVLFNEKVMLP